MNTKYCDLLITSLPFTTAATGVLTSDNTNVADGETVTIGSRVYRYKNTMAAINDVKIGADADTSLVNLAKAINLSGTAGTHYFAGTEINNQVTANETITAHALTTTGKGTSAADNLIATTKTSAHLSWGHTTMWGADGGRLDQITLSGATTYYSEAIDAGQYDEIICFLNTLTQAGTTPTLDISFEFSPDGITWMATGDAFTQVTTSTGLTFKRLTANFGKYLRAKLVLGGTNPKYKLSLTVQGKS